MWRKKWVLPNIIVHLLTVQKQQKFELLNIWISMCERNLKISYIKGCCNSQCFAACLQFYLSVNSWKKKVKKLNPSREVMHSVLWLDFWGMNRVSISRGCNSKVLGLAYLCCIIFPAISSAAECAMCSCFFLYFMLFLLLLLLSFPDRYFIAYINF